MKHFDEFNNYLWHINAFLLEIRNCLASHCSIAVKWLAMSSISN